MDIDIDVDIAIDIPISVLKRTYNNFLLPRIFQYFRYILIWLLLTDTRMILILYDKYMTIRRRKMIIKKNL